jgi:hypothetical protein
VRRKRQWPQWDFFEQFVERDGERVQFANWLRTGGRFRDRCWPVFARDRRFAKRPWARSRLGNFRDYRDGKMIDRNAHLLKVRRRLPCNPLYAHVMKVEDALMARLGRRR